MDTDTMTENVRLCEMCNETKTIDNYYFTNKGHYRRKCKDCWNQRRRARYATDEEHRQRHLNECKEYKARKTEERQKARQEFQEQIGLENFQCRYCNEIKPQERFRHNRKKCKDCERDDPMLKMHRKYRSIVNAGLKSVDKTSIIPYLRCSSQDYDSWLYDYDNRYKKTPDIIWNIDHVIPLSKFDFEKKEDRLLALNWRNTRPLPEKENLAKNNKIIDSQIRDHYTKLIEYHNEKGLEMPEQFTNLFARYLDDRGRP